ncbi:MAG: peptidoglycan-associated lipoprotein [Thermodesulfovibrio sp.]|nr:peptidoglycan-associated lipoprotein [Thermodesulfovibrio sp.]
MNRILTAVMLAMLLVISGGCSQKKVSTIDSSSVKASTDSGKSTDKAADSGKKIPTESITSLDKDQKDTVPAYVKELQSRLQDIYFDYDKYTLSDDARTKTRMLSDLLTKNNSLTVTIEGHCDERGTNEYNLALGDRRSKAVKEYLVALGILASRVEVISYGEEKPACSESSEACWAKNRRDHPVLSAAKQ